MKIDTQGHFLEKLVLWFYVFLRLAYNSQWPASKDILPTILAQTSEVGCQAWCQSFEEKSFDSLTGSDPVAYNYFSDVGILDSQSRTSPVNNRFAFTHVMLRSSCLGHDNHVKLVIGLTQWIQRFYGWTFNRGINFIVEYLISLSIRQKSIQ